MTEAPRFRQEEIQSLPRWARLAFAARCVGRARTLLQGPPDYVKVIDRAIRLVEESSWKGRPEEKLADAAAAADTLALKTVELTPPAGAAGTAPDEDTLIIACTVAHAAAFAAEAGTIAVAKMASYLASQSVDFAIQAHLVASAETLAEVIAAMRDDLEMLQTAMAREGWGNLSPMPVDLFEGE
jgi:hypothetical protein